MSKKVLWRAAALFFLLIVVAWMANDVYYCWPLIVETWDTDGTYRSVGIVVVVSLYILFFLGGRRERKRRKKKKEKGDKNGTAAKFF